MREVFPVRQFKILSKNQEKESEFWGQLGKNLIANTEYILLVDGSFLKINSTLRKKVSILGNYFTYFHSVLADLMG